ncbi:hypothetical protein LJR009_000013 [Bosea sp. LjRoot9]|uniref:hypothetical protein n=1 Tax=Bosea sp. LjRoot9 TaxID=3342341 RepID=UPI003ECCADE5
MSPRVLAGATILAAIALPQAPALAQDADELSKKLANPVASMISIPIQTNFDFRGGPGRNGLSSTTNIQPVIPVSLNQDWNLIVRTILPVIHRDRYGTADGTGLGDITQSFFFTPKNRSGGITWGIGPAFLWPTATDDRFGSGKWGAGPTALVLTQQGAWTVGGLANHIWSYAGPNGRQDVSATFLQPFLSYQFGKGLSASLNAEASYDWIARQWTVPINVGLAQVFKVGEQAMSASVGLKYYAVRASEAPRWGVRATLTFLLPER